MKSLSFEDKKTQEMRSRHVCVGLLAHVDAGKTTLSESLLYMSHAIKKKAGSIIRTVSLTIMRLSVKGGSRSMLKKHAFLIKISNIS